MLSFGCIRCRRLDAAGSEIRRKAPVSYVQLNCEVFVSVFSSVSFFFDDFTVYWSVLNSVKIRVDCVRGCNSDFRLSHMLIDEMQLGVLNLRLRLRNLK